MLAQPTRASRIVEVPAGFNGSRNLHLYSDTLSVELQVFQSGVLTSSPRIAVAESLHSTFGGCFCRAQAENVCHRPGCAGEFAWSHWPSKEGSSIG